MKTSVNMVMYERNIAFAIGTKRWLNDKNVSANK